MYLTPANEPYRHYINSFNWQYSMETKHTGPRGQIGIQQVTARQQLPASKYFVSRQSTNSGGFDLSGISLINCS